MKTFKKPLVAVVGVTAACAACCAIPLAVPAILGVAGITSASFGGSAVAVATGVAAIALLGVALWQRARTKAQACGCASSCDVKASS